MPLINVSNLHWVTERSKRNESILRTLLRQGLVASPAIFVNPPVYHQGRLSRLFGWNQLRVAEQLTYGPGQVLVLQPVCNLLVANSPALTAWFARWTAAQILARYGQPGQNLLWMNSVGAFQAELSLALAPSCQQTVLDNSDDLPTCTDNEALGRQRLEKLLPITQRSIYVNAHLASRYPHPQSFVFENGIADEILTPESAPVEPLAPYFPKPQLPNSGPTPYLVFSGGLHTNRVDLPLLEHLFAQFPHARFFFIGHSNNPQFFAKFLDRPNCVQIADVPYRRLRQLLAQCDIGIVPHVDNEHTRANNLLKVLDYFSVGLPVVSTRVSGVESYGAALDIADSPEQFVALCQAHLDLAAANPAAAAAARQSRLDIARGRTWSQSVPALAAWALPPNPLKPETKPAKP